MESSVYPNSIDEQMSSKEVMKKKAAAFDQAQKQSEIDDAVNSQLGKVRVYGQGGLAGLAKDDQRLAYDQQKNDLATMILQGSPEEAQQATQFAMQDGQEYFTPEELDAIVYKRQLGENPNIQKSAMIGGM